MNPLIQLKRTSSVFLVALLLACFGFLPAAYPVVPAPDGGYPGGNTAEGQNALHSLTTGGFNTAVGFLSLRSDTTGQLNTAIGAATLLANTGDNNTATGAAALLSNSTGNYNTANGVQALFSNTTGVQNTAVGVQALASNTMGFFNTAVGLQALGGNTTGSGNIAIGYVAGSGITTADNVIAIGTPGANVNDSCYIANIAGQTVGAGGVACYVDNDGKLGVFLSARRFKTDITDMGAASEALLALRPVTFHYKPELDKTGIPQFGLVAEEVAKVNPDLVTHDAKGELSSVRYEAVNAMLLNEFLKEHRKNEEQEAAIAELKKAIARLAARDEEQAAQIQKVSAQLEASKPAPQVVNNP
jgi:hypothetical protein